MAALVLAQIQLGQFQLRPVALAEIELRQAELGQFDLGQAQLLLLAAAVALAAWLSRSTAVGCTRSRAGRSLWCTSRSTRSGTASRLGRTGWSTRSRAARRGHRCAHWRAGPGTRPRRLAGRRAVAAHRSVGAATAHRRVGDAGEFVGCAGGPDRCHDGPDALLGGIDVVVNNAGGTAPRPFLQTSKGYIERSFHFNVLTAFELSKAAVPHMLERGGGSIGSRRPIQEPC